MTAFTASVSGLASATATWGGAAGPAANGDTMTINAGVVVDWDKDLTGLTTGLGASVNNGTIQAHRAAGNYGFKMNAAALSGTGVIDASDGVGGAYSGGVFQILFNGAASITVAGIQNILCKEPVNKYVKLSQAESSTATTLHVDTDVTGEPTYWKNGDLIYVCNINGGSQGEQYTINGSPTSTTIPITPGLSNSKLSGSYVVLVSRNVKIVGTGTGTGISGAANGSVINAEVRNVATGFASLTASTIGGSITTAANGITTSVIGCIVNSSILGCTTSGINTPLAFAIHGIIAACATGVSAPLSGYGDGIIAGCTNGISSPNAFRFTGIVDGCANGQSNGSAIYSGAVLRNNGADINQANFLTAFSTLFASSTEFSNYTRFGRSINDYAESFDHDQVAGAYRNWCKGGITSSNTGTIYGTRPRSYQHALQNDSLGNAAYSFRDQTIEVPAGGWINVNAFAQKDASMAFLPQLQIFPASVEPLISGSPSASATMTNSTNTWEILFAKYQNTSTAPQLVKVRVIGQNASGNLYEDTDISTSPFAQALEAA